MTTRIGYLIDQISTDKAGTEKQLLGIIKRLDRARFQPYIICLKRSPWLKANQTQCSIYCLEYKGLTKPTVLKTAMKLKKLINHLSIDIVHCFFNESIFISYLSKILSTRFPLLVSSRRDMGLSSDEPWYHGVYRLVFRLVNTKFDGVVANSQKVASWVCEKERLDPRKIKVIPNGVEICDKTLQVPSVFLNTTADVWIGIAANLRSIKRVDLLLNAFHLLKKECENKNIKIVVIGNGSQRDALVDLSKDLGISSHVLFVGRVNNVVAYLQNIDIGVLCSDKEGLSNAILEYMACRLPVIATDVGGNSELVDESNGMLVPRGDAMGLARALKTLALNEELRKTKGELSFRKVQQTYIWEKVMREWEGYYTLLISGKRDSNRGSSHEFGG